MGSDLGGRVVAGKYAVLSVIGQGAMGVVYRARQIALDKVVALKVLSEELRSDPEFVLRFHTEARAASRLDHPNSTRVLDFGQEPDGLLYIAMELLSGRTLADVIESEFPLQPARAAGILTQVLSAVGAAHGLKILHRDLKPENIVILEGRDDEDRRVDVVKVCDFGIAKLESEASEMRSATATEQPASPKATMAGIILGTPQYMSPEQARGDPLDVRSDLYSLGVVLFEMLTRRAPFDGKVPADVLQKHVFEAPPRPSSLQPDVDPTLEAVCLKALQKSPEHRFASAREMRLALRSVVGQGHVDIVPAPSQPRGYDASLPTISAEPVAVASLPKRPRRLLWLVPAAAACAVAALVWRTAAHPAAEHPSPGPVTATRVEVSARQALPTPHIVAAVAPPQATNDLPTHVRAPSARATTAALLPTVSATDAIAEPVVTFAPPPPPPPAVTVTAAPSATASPVVADVVVPRFDPTTARVALGVVRADRVDPASVTSALRHADLEGCYRDVLRDGSDVDGDATLALEMDEEHITRADVVGGRFSAALRQCISQRVLSLRVPSVDTGDAAAKVTLHFTVR